MSTVPGLLRASGHFDGEFRLVFQESAKRLIVVIFGCSEMESFYGQK